jgi:hypothetical protein
MGALNPSVVIVVVLVAAALFVVIGYSIHRLLWGPDPEPEFNQRSDTQDAYMRDVRIRNRAINWHEGRLDRSKNPA